jgi:RsiW-degrading membrane proteinase PrsW (M82 family)
MYMRLGKVGIRRAGFRSIRAEEYRVATVARSTAAALGQDPMNAISANFTPKDEIDSFTIRLYFLSRDYGVLGLIALLVISISAALAWLWRAPDAMSMVAQPPAREIEALMASPRPDAQRIIELLPLVTRELPADFQRRLVESSLDPAATLVIGSYAESLREWRDEPNALLLILAHQPEPAPWANAAVGDLLARRGDFDRARSYLLREVHYHPSPATHAKLVTTLAHHGAFVALGPVVTDAEFAPYFPATLKMRLALHEHRWADAARALITVERETLSPLPLVAALVAGFAWFLIAVQAGQPLSWWSFRTFAPSFAVLLGLGASLAARLVSAWQEEIVGLRLTGEFLTDFAFYIGNVAPREELLKLCFVVPFLPWLLTRKNPLETLIVSGCVGLGFAIEGNLQAYQHVGPDGAFGRLLTANFFHLAATGMLGRALVEWIQSRGRKWVRFLGTLVGVMTASAIYNAFMTVPGARWLSAASMLSFFVLSLVFFYDLRRWRDHATDQLYLSATLVFGLSLLTGAMLVCAATQLGFTAALHSLAINAAGLLLVIVVFFRQLGRGLAAYDRDGLATFTP